MQAPVARGDASPAVRAAAASVTAQTLLMIPEAERLGLIAGLSAREAEALNRDWPTWQSDAQAEPGGDWRVWLMLAGRGFGKTRLGSQWVRALAAANPEARIALVAATMAEVRSVMIEGESGLLAVTRAVDQVHWEPSLGRLTWGNGAQAFAYSAETPEALRGPQHHFAWCDELAKWKAAKTLWDNLMLGLRLGERPRSLVTTTPRSVALLRSLIKTDGVIVRRGGTNDNPYLPTAFTKSVNALYAGTRIGRQELDGELIEDVKGALWTRDMIEHARVRVLPTVRRVVVAVDPPAGVGGDSCGIVAAALGHDGKAYVIEDASVSGKTPDGWAARVAACAARHHADRVVAEANNGGKMVESVLRGADYNMPIKLVHASHGKVARAEPVMTLYRLGRAFHVGSFPDLEDELCGLITGGGYEGPGRSPDRADALVWAMTELMLGKTVGDGPRITGF
jgi:phage terminase large subunit-like protein